MSEILTVRLGSARLEFDPAQGLDLRCLRLGDVTLSPGPGYGEGQPEPIGRALEGIMLSCGPDHIRQPCHDGSTLWPLHGSFALSHAKQVMVTQAKGHKQVTAEIPILAADGGRMTVYRRYQLSETRMGLRIAIRDRIRALSGSPVRPMMMYHLNFPRRLFTPSTTLQDRPIPQGSCHHCTAARPVVRLGGVNGGTSSISIVPHRGTLGWTQVWGDSRLLCIEPASLPLVPRSHLVATEALKTLNEGDEMTFGLRMSFHGFIPAEQHA